MDHPSITRRTFLTSTLTASGLSLAGAGLAPRLLQAAPAFISLDHQRPQMAQGLQFGDVTATRGMVWSRSDRPARLLVEYSYRPDFKSARRVRGPVALAETDYTARLDLAGLRAGERVYVRARFEDLSRERTCSEWLRGQFCTAPARRERDVRFVWGGDTAGQGWGINPDFGGMRIYESMRRVKPDFFIHSGDTIYADSPISAEQDAENGVIWRNLVTEEVSKVAETLNEFRGRYRYNLLDHNLRAFNAEVPQIWQWDDHEVVNNWSDAKDLSDDDRYTEKSVPLLVARGARAFAEYAPMRPFDAREAERIYRHLPYGELLDVFVLDMRSYRGPNTANDQRETGPETHFLGRAQLNWLKEQLRASKATWKIIAADMPVGLIVRDGPDKFENGANGDGEPLGRELEMVELLRFIKRHRIEDVVWVTADVHYCAAHHYHPERAVFQDFTPFWEFVAGPLNAGSFGPGELDNTFGPQVDFQRYPDTANQSPLAGLQFFGAINIDRASGALTAALKDIDGKTVYEKTLAPSRHGHRPRG